VAEASFDKRGWHAHFPGMKPLLFGKLTFVSVLGAALALTAAETVTPKAGDKAPLFEAKDEAGKTWKLANALGKQAVLLYFYPKDDTAGCTKQACGFRDRMEEFKNDGVQVVGVSFDSGESHLKFIAKHNLNFPLLADTDGKIADAYGVRIEGRNVARRVSFLIGKDGKIAHVTDTPSADVHLREMQEAVARLKKS
jgi:peroxiredoxin Q/BCP